MINNVINRVSIDIDVDDDDDDDDGDDRCPNRVNGTCPGDDDGGNGNKTNGDNGSGQINQTITPEPITTTPEPQPLPIVPGLLPPVEEDNENFYTPVVRGECREHFIYVPKTGKCTDRDVFHDFDELDPRCQNNINQVANSIASFIFCRNSCSVSPWLMTAGNSKH
jgi:hypothetical protein